MIESSRALEFFTQDADLLVARAVARSNSHEDMAALEDYVAAIEAGLGGDDLRRAQHGRAITLLQLSEPRQAAELLMEEARVMSADQTAPLPPKVRYEVLCAQALAGNGLIAANLVQKLLNDLGTVTDQQWAERLVAAGLAINGAISADKENDWLKLAEILPSERRPQWQAAIRWRAGRPVDLAELTGEDDDMLYECVTALNQLARGQRASAERIVDQLLPEFELKHEQGRSPGPSRECVGRLGAQDVDLQ